MDNPNKLPLEYLYNCPRCGVPFHARIHRSWLIKRFFPKWPVRRFFCGDCLKKYYIKIDADDIDK
ncbi:hypothetical protein BEL04_10810 [Mucilaginibacter sp. PPCGB 2223]|uniref:hypothetical protein n=1 Tax=Mucilaginibacter sp. PPCGB 2223 TaxID=1886027 RepID=UPI0008267CE1|nr:hypothetical protein [Mucilaginibacter sp. PPCGB 2223]OCX54706.1 hypothetical protein BEL04_10810 [Mucilaginibacter sp. PPCGB 2223]